MKKLISLIISVALVATACSMVFSASAYKLDIGGQSSFNFPQLVQNGNFEIGTGVTTDINASVTSDQNIANTTDTVKNNNDFMTSRIPAYVSDVATLNPSKWERTTGGAVFNPGTNTVNGYSGIVYEPVYNSGTSTYTRNLTNHVAKIGQEITQRIPSATVGNSYQIRFRMFMKEQWNSNFSIKVGDLTGITMPNNYNLTNYSVYRMTSTTVGSRIAYGATAAPAVTFSLNDASTVNTWVDYIVNFTIASVPTAGATGTPALQFRSEAWNSTVGADGTSNTNNVFVYMDDVSMYDMTSFPLVSADPQYTIFAVGLDTDSSQYVRFASIRALTNHKVTAYLKSTIPLKDKASYTLSTTIRQTAGTVFGRTADSNKNPSMVAFEPGALGYTGTATGATWSEGQNDYAYSYWGGSQMDRRTNINFNCFYVKDGKTFTYTQVGSSAVGRDTWTRYNTAKSASDPTVTADSMYANWVTQGYSFTSSGQTADAANHIVATTGDVNVSFAIMLPYDKDSIDIKNFSVKRNFTASTETLSDSMSTGGTVQVTENGSSDTLTAIPYKGYAFDGWYMGSTLLSTDNPYTFIPTDTMTSAPVAKFKAFGAVYPEGSFENLPVGTNLIDYIGSSASDATAVNKNYLCSFRSFNNYTSSKWAVYGGESGNWSQALVSTDRAHTGSKSLKLTSTYQTVLSRKTLLPNTWYEMSFWYYQASGGASTSSLEMYGAWKFNTTATAAVTNAISGVALNTTTDQVYDAWKQCKVKFYTGSNTDVVMGFKYINNTAYIDDFYVTEISSINSVGTAVRAAEASSGIKQGLRFKTRIDLNAVAKTIASHNFKVVEYGTVAIKSEYLGSNALTVGGSYDFGGVQKAAAKGVAYSAANNINVIYNKDDAANTLDYTGVLTNISTANLNKSYTTRPYMIVEDATGTQTTIYGDAQTASVFDIAKQAYENVSGGSYVESRDTRLYLFNSVLHVVDPTTYATFQESPVV